MWEAKPTGNMTLSVLDENGLQILKVDMLSYNTMKAGSNGNLLTCALNDLNIIANFSCDDYDISDDNLMFPGEGFSPLPWRLEHDDKKRRIVLKSGAHRKIAERLFPKNVPSDSYQKIVEKILKGLEIINSEVRHDQND